MGTGQHAGVDGICVVMSQSARILGLKPQQFRLFGAPFAIHQEQDQGQEQNRTGTAAKDEPGSPLRKSGEYAGTKLKWSNHHLTKALCSIVDGGPRRVWPATYQRGGRRTCSFSTSWSSHVRHQAHDLKFGNPEKHADVLISRALDEMLWAH